MNYSAVILFKKNQASKKLAQVQHSIAARFGGASAIRLPPHVTLAKWASKTSVRETFISAVGGITADFTINMGPVELSVEDKAIWYRVEESDGLLATAVHLAELLRLAGVKLENTTFSTRLHLTLAYKDYSATQIAAIFESIQQMRLPEFVSLKAESIAVCQATSRGIWAVIGANRAQRNWHGS